jgi:hypothetical protein
MLISRDPPPARLQTPSSLPGGDPGYPHGIRRATTAVGGLLAGDSRGPVHVLFPMTSHPILFSTLLCLPPLQISLSSAYSALAVPDLGNLRSIGRV